MHRPRAPILLPVNAQVRAEGFYSIAGALQFYMGGRELFAKGWGVPYYSMGGSGWAYYLKGSSFLFIERFIGRRRSCYLSSTGPVGLLEHMNHKIFMGIGLTRPYNNRRRGILHLSQAGSSGGVWLLVSE